MAKHKILTGTLSRGNPNDAGQDITANDDYIIYPYNSESISTGLRVNIAEGYVGLVWSRSGLSFNSNIETGAGCIDSGYTGEVKVKLYNNGEGQLSIQKGDRIAQLITLPVDTSDYEQVDELINTKRGDKGFGSTGK